MTTRAMIAVAICAIVIGVAIFVSASAQPLWAFLVLPFVADSL